MRPCGHAWGLEAWWTPGFHMAPSLDNWNIQIMCLVKFQAWIPIGLNIQLRIQIIPTHQNHQNCTISFFFFFLMTWVPYQGKTFWIQSWRVNPQLHVLTTRKFPFMQQGRSKCLHPGWCLRESLTCFIAGLGVWVVIQWFGRLFLIA